MELTSLINTYFVDWNADNAGHGCVTLEDCVCKSMQTSISYKVSSFDIHYIYTVESQFLNLRVKMVWTIEKFEKLGLKFKFDWGKWDDFELLDSFSQKSLLGGQSGPWKPFLCANFFRKGPINWKLLKLVALAVSVTILSRVVALKNTTPVLILQSGKRKGPK